MVQDVMGHNSFLLLLISAMKWERFVSFIAITTAEFEVCSLVRAGMFERPMTVLCGAIGEAHVRSAFKKKKGNT